MQESNSTNQNVIKGSKKFCELESHTEGQIWLRETCPRCGSETDSYKSYTMTGKGGTTVRVFLFKCSQCRKAWRQGKELERADITKRTGNPKAKSLPKARKVTSLAKQITREQFDEMQKTMSPREIATLLCQHYTRDEDKARCPACRKAIVRLRHKIEKLKKASQSYAPIDNFNKIPEIQSFIEFQKAKGVKHKYMFSKLRMFWQWLRKNHRLASKQRPVLWDIEVVQFILAKISELGVASYGYKQALRQFFWSQNKTDLIRHPLLRARRKDMRSPNCVSTRKDFFTPEEFERIRKSPEMLPDEILTMDLHVTLGCREGKPLVNPNASLLGINWGRYNREVKTIDVWEPKTGGGTWWRDIPLDLFFRDLPAKLETLWLSLDKPSEGRILSWSYEQLRGIYKKASKILGRKVNPHDARRSHATWLLDADCDVRAIIGEYNPQRGEGRALGVGWENPEIFFRRYGRLSKKKRVQEMEKVRGMYWT